MAKERPYPGSTTVTTVNGGVVGLTRTLVEELKPLRVNSIHPGVVGDSPYWAEKPAAIPKYTVEDPDRPPGDDGRDRRRVGLPAREPAVNGVDLIVDGAGTAGDRTTRGRGGHNQALGPDRRDDGQIDDRGPRGARPAERPPRLPGDGRAPARGRAAAGG